MKRYFLITITVLLSMTPMFSQQAQGGKEQLARQAKHYIALFSLGEEQGKQFEAMYYAYNKKMHEIHLTYKKERPAEGEKLSEEELEKRILDNFAQSKAILTVREEYYKKFRAVLSPSQINSIFEDEKARRAQMRKDLKNGQAYK